MEMGKLYEVSFVVEGYQSSGSFEFTDLDVFVKDPVAAEDVVEESSPLTIYPNSKPGYLSVKSNVPDSDSNIKIYDASGKIVYTRENINNDILLVSGLKNGMYFVKVQSSRLDYTAKVPIF